MRIGQPGHNGISFEIYDARALALVRLGVAVRAYKNDLAGFNGDCFGARLPSFTV